MVRQLAHIAISETTKTSLLTSESSTRLIGSVAITVPGTYFILNSGGHKGDDHHLHQGSVEGEGKGEELDDSHEESTEESTEESLDEEPAKDQEESDDQKEDAAAVKQDDSEDNKDDKEDDKTEDVKSGDNKIEGKPAKSDNEGKTVTEQPSDNKISEKTKDGDDSFDKEHEIETDSENKTIHKPDAKGGAKRRVESANAIELNKESQGEDEDDKVSSCFSYFVSPNNIDVLTRVIPPRLRHPRTSPSRAACLRSKPASPTPTPSIRPTPSRTARARSPRAHRKRPSCRAPSSPTDHSSKRSFGGLDWEIDFRYVEEKSTVDNVYYTTPCALIDMYL